MTPAFQTSTARPFSRRSRSSTAEKTRSSARVPCPNAAEPPRTTTRAVPGAFRHGLPAEVGPPAGVAVEVRAARRDEPEPPRVGLEARHLLGRVRRVVDLEPLQALAGEEVEVGPVAVAPRVRERRDPARRA